MKSFDIGEITLVGPCDHKECRNSPAGTTVQISRSGLDGTDTINIPIQDIDAFVLALRSAAGCI